MKIIPKNKLIIIIILLMMFFLTMLSSNVYASSISDIFTKADDFVKNGQNSTTAGTTISTDTMKSMSELIYNTLLIIGVAVAVIIGIILGVKFMAGSVEEKANIKNSLIAYIAGCVVVFGAFTIWKIVVTILQSAPTAYKFNYISF